MWPLNYGGRMEPEQQWISAKATQKAGWKQILAARKKPSRTNLSFGIIRCGSAYTYGRWTHIEFLWQVLYSELAFNNTCFYGLIFQARRVGKRLVFWFTGRNRRFMVWRRLPDEDPVSLQLWLNYCSGFSLVVLVDGFDISCSCWVSVLSLLEFKICL